MCFSKKKPNGKIKRSKLLVYSMYQIEYFAFVAKYFVMNYLVQLKNVKIIETFDNNTKGHEKSTEGFDCLTENVIS